MFCSQDHVKLTGLRKKSMMQRNKGVKENASTETDWSIATPLLREDTVGVFTHKNENSMH